MEYYCIDCRPQSPQSVSFIYVWSKLIGSSSFQWDWNSRNGNVASFPKVPFLISPSSPPTNTRMGPDLNDKGWSRFPIDVTRVKCETGHISNRKWLNCPTDVISSQWNTAATRQVFFLTEIFFFRVIFSALNIQTFINDRSKSQQNLKLSSGLQVSEHLDDVLGHGWGPGTYVTLLLPLRPDGLLQRTSTTRHVYDAYGDEIGQRLQQPAHLTAPDQELRAPSKLGCLWLCRWSLWPRQRQRTVNLAEIICTWTVYILLECTIKRDTKKGKTPHAPLFYISLLKSIIYSVYSVCLTHLTPVRCSQFLIHSKGAETSS